MKCLISYCNREAKTRGLCTSCYQLARLKVLQGKATWESLSSYGLALPKKNQGGEGGPFNRAFKQISHK